jgi:hypothetical protein
MAGAQAGLMAVTDEILRSWRDPQAAIRRQLPWMTEGRALTYLLLACVMIIVAQMPRLARAAHLNPEVPFEPQLLAAALGILAAVPAVAYGLAALTHLLSRAFGGQGSWLGARLALFWTLLSIAPLVLLHGLIAGMIGPGIQLNIAGGVLVAAFFLHWLLTLAEAEWGQVAA